MQQDTEFTELIWEYYRSKGRDLPWRKVLPSGNCEPYAVLVSEFMLQQTQVNRVIPKFDEFISRFPSIEDLAGAQLSEVIKLWSGLGYNRRAKYLHDAAQTLVLTTPWTVDLLESCKGIGHNTAAAIAVYAYNQPHIFIETNIRTVYIHHYFPDSDQVSDRELMAVVARTIDKEHPREWYWALMDYGTYLKGQRVKSAVKSKHYVRQSAFEGSNRQIRGQVIRLLTQSDKTTEELKSVISDTRLPQILEQLRGEGLITINGSIARLA